MSELIHDKVVKEILQELVGEPGKKTAFCGEPGKLLPTGFSSSGSALS